MLLICSVAFAAPDRAYPDVEQPRLMGYKQLKCRDDREKKNKISPSSRNFALLSEVYLGRKMIVIRCVWVQGGDAVGLQN